MMEHFLLHPTSDTFACGADAVGRRNPRVQCDPRNTTCRRCKEHDVWGDATFHAQAFDDAMKRR